MQPITEGGLGWSVRRVHRALDLLFYLSYPGQGAFPPCAETQTYPGVCFHSLGHISDGIARANHGKFASTWGDGRWQRPGDRLPARLKRRKPRRVNARVERAFADLRVLGLVERISLDGRGQRTARHRRRFRANPRYSGAVRGYAFRLLLPAIPTAEVRDADPQKRDADPPYSPEVRGADPKTRDVDPFISPATETESAFSGETPDGRAYGERKDLRKNLESGAHGAPPTAPRLDPTAQRELNRLWAKEVLRKLGAAS
ncbi:MAG: hypothetical protein ACRELC_03170 [Gemmatimonadota bacterium]